MNKLAKIIVKGLGTAGGLIAMGLIMNGTNKLINGSSEKEEDSTTDEDEAE